MKPSINRLVALSLSCAVLSSCSIFEPANTAIDTNEPTNTQQTDTPLTASQAFQQQFKHHFNSAPEIKAPKPTAAVSAAPPMNIPHGSKLNINHYAQGLMQSLMENLEYVNNTTPVAVTSFVMLDSDYNQSSLLGNQLAESLIHEIHNFGIPVIDYKTTGFIRITPQGDFAFSKDYEELGSDLAARYIVGGTMVKHSQGLLVNARVVGLSSKAVVASAQSFIPYHIVNSLVTTHHKGNTADAQSSGTEHSNMHKTSQKIALVNQ